MIFQNNLYNEQLRERGYVVLSALLQPEEIRRLSDLYQKFRPGVAMGFHVTNWIAAQEYSDTSHASVCSVLLPRLEQVLNPFQAVLGCFAVKEPGLDNAMGLHQDWSLTDEAQFDSVSVWVPLCDINEKTGSFYLLPGSHRLFRNIRGQNIANELDELSIPLLMSKMDCLSLKAGDAIVLHHRVVHCTAQNQENFPRIAAMLALIPQGAPLLHFYRNPGDTATAPIRRFVFPEQHYVHFEINRFPKDCEELDPVQQHQPVVTNEAVEQFYRLPYS